MSQQLANKQTNTTTKQLLCSSTLVCSLFAMKTPWPKVIWRERRGLFHFVGYSPSWRKVGRPGTQAMEGCCLLAYSSWLTQLALTQYRTTCPWMPSPTLGWAHWHRSSSKQTNTIWACYRPVWQRQFYNWGTFCLLFPSLSNWWPPPQKKNKKSLTSTDRNNSEEELQEMLTLL
jgi:hypothetical protein